MAEGAYAKAEWVLQECLAILTDYGAELIDRGIITRAALACAARGLGRASQAEQVLAEALRRCMETPALWPPLYAIAACAPFLVDRGEVARAVELYALTARYPFVANSRWFEDVFGEYVAAAAEALPPEVVAVAQARGRARDLAATLAELSREV